LMLEISGHSDFFSHCLWFSKSDGLSVVNTKLNCRLSISALSLGASFSSPFSLRGAISIDSVFLCLWTSRVSCCFCSYCLRLSQILYTSSTILLWLSLWTSWAASFSLFWVRRGFHGFSYVDDFVS
jgi:hypothetical protein